MSDYQGYSAKVVLTLKVGEQRLALSHLGPTEMVVRDSCDPIPPGDAKILIQVDERKTKRRVYLPEGVPGPRQLVPFSSTPF
jgi:hypothetical protein